MPTLRSAAWLRGGPPRVPSTVCRPNFNLFHPSVISAEWSPAHPFPPTRIPRRPLSPAPNPKIDATFRPFSRGAGGSRESFRGMD